MTILGGFGLGDKMEAADWPDEHVAPTALSASGLRAAEACGRREPVALSEGERGGPIFLLREPVCC